MGMEKGSAAVQRLAAVSGHLKNTALGNKKHVLLIANRGEVAARIALAASQLDPPLRTLSIHTGDDLRSLHILSSDSSLLIPGAGAPAYLDGQAIIAAAKQAGATILHPGYGFLSESPAFARAVEEAGMVWVGPTPEQLEMYGDKTRAKELARRCSVPVMRGTEGDTSLEDALAFFDSLPPGSGMMIKAISGGGGRGMRSVLARNDLEEAYRRCRGEAHKAFGDDRVYVEQLVKRARHVEVQVLGDGRGKVRDLGERECTLQRRNQKIVEVAPSPSINAALRTLLVSSALRMARAGRYRSLGTFEFLVQDDGQFFFMEANPRLQVEHTVTEEAYGMDIVKLQLRLALGVPLSALALEDRPSQPSRYALQLRINAETYIAPDAGTGTRLTVYPSSGILRSFVPPTGPGVRVDTVAYSGYEVTSRYDSLLAKLILTAPTWPEVLQRSRRALHHFVIEGIQTNKDVLLGILSLKAVREAKVWTTWVEENWHEVVEAGRREAEQVQLRTASFWGDVGERSQRTRVPTNEDQPLPDGHVGIRAPMAGTIVSIDVKPGDVVRPEQQLAVLEALKMEHVIRSPRGGEVVEITASTGDVLQAEKYFITLRPSDSPEAQAPVTIGDVDIDHIRKDLQDLFHRRQLNSDESRRKAVESRRRTGRRTALENVRDLVDEGSFVEYGEMALAAQRSRRSVDELLGQTARDGIITGLGSVNRSLFDDDASRVALLVYDFTVLAGTQGFFNHAKQDRILRLAEQYVIPVVLYAEGGGGRPGDVDTNNISIGGLHGPTFHLFAKLSGLVPLVGVVSGYCFAGNAALLGCCDVIIATEDSRIGMGGPAMIEGGGLGRFKPDQIGPPSIQEPNGVIDVLVSNEAEATAVAKKYLSYFQGPVKEWSCPDQRLLRHLVPEERNRSFDVRKVIEALADEGSVLELRPTYGLAILTALIRIEGHPFALLASSPLHLSGAIDSPSSSKASRFIQLADAYDLPIISLIDTPGFLVGPEAEKSAQVRVFGRMFVAAASVTVPVFAVMLRRGFGLGAMAMAGGGFHANFYCVSWPGGIFGGMGLEGAVRLAFRRELEAVQDPQEREDLFESLVGQMYERGKAENMASHLEIDQVIDPAETRHWIVRGLKSCPTRAWPSWRGRKGKKRPMIDTF